MFTVPVGSGSGYILVARPSASSGTITNAAQAYDMPGGANDDPPYSTNASRAIVTGSATPGTVDYDVVEYNTFPSRAKSNFSLCQLAIGITSTVSPAVVASSFNFKTGLYDTSYVTSSIAVDYQVDGTNWVNIGTFSGHDPFTGANLGEASNLVAVNTPILYTAGVNYPETIKSTLTKIIPAASFPSNLNSLKIRFRMGTCTNNAVTTSKSNGSYLVWDIRANIS